MSSSCGNTSAIVLVSWVQENKPPCCLLPCRRHWFLAPRVMQGVLEDSCCFKEHKKREVEKASAHSLS